MFMENKFFGILLAEPVADVIAGTVTTISFVTFYKKTFGEESLVSEG